jgi:ribose transport system ATP-binding protein
MNEGEIVGEIANADLSEGELFRLSFKELA